MRGWGSGDSSPWKAREVAAASSTAGKVGRAGWEWWFAGLGNRLLACARWVSREVRALEAHLWRAHGVRAVLGDRRATNMGQSLCKANKASALC